MAQMLRPNIALFSMKCSNKIVPRICIPIKYQRLCFHTSWVLDVKGKKLSMPSLSPTMETGTIIKWLKAEGDKINPGDALADIQTDKAVVAMEYEEECILAKIIVPEGTKDVKIGTLIGLIVEPDEDWKTVEMPDDTATLKTPPSQTASSPQPDVILNVVSAAAPPPGQQNISMPSLSPTMDVGTIVRWLKKEGDEIAPGDALAEIQTDKAVMTFELEEECILAKILMPEGSKVPVGHLVAITVEKGMDWKQVVIPTDTKPTAAPTAVPTTPADTAKPSGQVFGLAVKRLLEEYSLNPVQIKGTGRPNRLLKSDVLSYIQQKNIQKVNLKAAIPSELDKSKKPASPSSTVKKDGKSKPATYENIPVSNIRRVIAKRLVESKNTIPHAYITMNIKIDKLNEIRNKLKSESINVSVNDFITKAVAHALLECPGINTLYKNEQVIQAPKADICIAVATPNGLLTPIIFDTSTKSLKQISDNIKDLANKARRGTLKPHEFQGGTFTISNLGMFSIKEFFAIINPPQTAILAVGSGQQELGADMTVSTIMTVSLSYDRRAIDEDQAADFLAVLRAMLEDPTFLAVGRMQALRHKRE